jgi:hypothetical protein
MRLGVRQFNIEENIQLVVRIAISKNVVDH